MAARDLLSATFVKSTTLGSSRSRFAPATVLPILVDIPIIDETSDNSDAPGANEPISKTVEGRRSGHGVHMSTLARRADSFLKEGWRSDLQSGALTNPFAMASAGWYCTGSSSAQCFACNKEMEDWEVTDDPQEVHESRCANCPLHIHRPEQAPRITWREQIRLDTAIEFYHKSLEQRQQAADVEQSFDRVRQHILRRLAELKQSK